MTNFYSSWYDAYDIEAYFLHALTKRDELCLHDLFLLLVKDPQHHMMDDCFIRIGPMQVWNRKRMGFTWLDCVRKNMETTEGEFLLF